MVGAGSPGLRACIFLVDGPKKWPERLEQGFLLLLIILCEFPISPVCVARLARHIQARLIWRGTDWSVGSIEAVNHFFFCVPAGTLFMVALHLFFRGAAAFDCSARCTHPGRSLETWVVGRVWFFEALGHCLSPWERLEAVSPGAIYILQ